MAKRILGSVHKQGVYRVCQNAFPGPPEPY